MAIDDLPSVVITFLNVIGVDWPYISEESLYKFGQIVREFAQAVEQTHEDATQAVTSAAQAYQGGSTQAMTSGWSHLSSTHVKELTTACGLVADALDAWAAFVVAKKAEALVQLIELAEGYVAAIAAAPETFGASLSALPELEEVGHVISETLDQTLQQFVIGEVISAAAKPLEQKIAQLLSGLDWSNAPGGVDPLGGGQVMLDSEAISQHTSTLRSHADTMRQHAQNVSDQISALEF